MGENLLAAAKELREGPEDALAKLIGEKKEELAAARQAGKLSRPEQQIRRRTIAALERVQEERKAGRELTEALRGLLTGRRTELGKAAAEAGKALENSIAFCERAFGEGRELLILMTELTADSHSAHFIARYGSEGYYRHNKALLLYERQQTILRELDSLEDEAP